jgi:hypothetical protein
MRPYRGNRYRKGPAETPGFFQLRARALRAFASRGPSPPDAATLAMTEQEVLFRDIATIKETINRDWGDLISLLLNATERAALPPVSTRACRSLST